MVRSARRENSNWQFLQQGLNSPYYHPGPHILWPGFEYIKVYREFRIPWSANISTFYTVALPIVGLAVLYGWFTQRGKPGSRG